MSNDELLAEYGLVGMPADRAEAIAIALVQATPGQDRVSSGWGARVGKVDSNGFANVELFDEDGDAAELLSGSEALALGLALIRAAGRASSK